MSLVEYNQLVFFRLQDYKTTRLQDYESVSESTVNGQRSTVNGQQSMVNGQQSTVNGQSVNKP